MEKLKKQIIRKLFKPFHKISQECDVTPLFSALLKTARAGRRDTSAGKYPPAEVSRWLEAVPEASALLRRSVRLA